MSGADLVSLYIMLGIGVAIMLYVRFLGGSDYFKLPRETYEPPPNQPWPPLVTQRSPDLSRCSDAVERGWPSLAA
jgi:hypothetical protein